jgi:N-formylglutamate amidohydrolase
MSGLILNLPYTAAGAPEALTKRLSLGPDDWQLEHWRLIDPPLGELVREAARFKRRKVHVERPVVAYPWSPVVADPWGLWAAELTQNEDQDQPRPPEPALLPRTTAGKPLTWGPKDREIIFNRAVRPYYQALEETLKGVLAEQPLALVVTVRSFDPMPLPFEKNRKRPRPQAAVSAAEGRTPAGLAELVGGVFKAFGWWPELDWPQNGGAVLPPGLAAHPRVRCLGLSLNRDLYLDERTGRKKASARGTVRVLTTLFNLLDQELDRVARVRLDRALKRKKDSPIIKASALKANACSS